MDALVIAALCAQLSYFQFSPIGTKVAGDTFDVSIVAHEANGNVYPYNGPAYLSTTRDIGRWPNVYPDRVNFSSGVCQTRAMVSLAAETLRLKCFEQQSRATGMSNGFDVLAGNAARYVTLLPGETLAAGSPQGKVSLPLKATSGVEFSIRTYVTDRWFNPIPFRNDSLLFAASDSFARFPLNPVLQNGLGTFPVTFRRASVHRIYTRPGGGVRLRTDTSSAFEVERAGFSRIVALMPGEGLLPGDTATRAYASPGKWGSRVRQYVREPFPVRVLGTDSCWNPAPVTPDSIVLNSDFAMTAQPAAALLRDTGVVFSVMFDSAGRNQNLWAVDLPRGIQTYPCLVDVEARTDSISVLLIRVDGRQSPPDTIRGGEIVRFDARMFDRNGQPVAAKWCNFRMVRGNGAFFIDTLGVVDTLSNRLTDTLARAITDSSGRATIRFVCERATTSEWDVIEFWADVYSRLESVYVAADTHVMLGNIIAYPNPLGLEGNKSTIEYYLPSTSDVISFAIYDPFGNEVLRRDFARGQEGNRNGINRVIWQGTNKSGRKVASGIYVVKVWGTSFTSRQNTKTYRIGVIW